jgi:phospholipid/cholesterol/gamma-HCH transport system substrate-binding protein
VQKSAPSVGRILIALGFTLSCFGLLLFLWVAFGGPVPLASKSYRITAYFPEATQLAVESDVRIGGVSVGKVKSIDLAPIDKQVDGLDTTEAEIEIEPEFAPISSDAKAILRSKTLLGETYVELTSGTEPGDAGAPVALGASVNNSDAETADVEAIPEGGTLGLGQVQNQNQIDELFNALDTETRSAFQRWQQGLAVAIKGRSLDLNDALGNLGPFLGDASDVLSVLRKQKTQLQGLVRDTGTVFDALSERNQQLAGAITGSNDTFGALASEQAALRDFFQVAPTFENETTLTLNRLDAFQANTRPLVRDLLPVANDISPTLRSIRRLSPPLKSLFFDLDDLTRASRRGFPALASTLKGLRPVLDNLDPFLANLDPVVSWLNYYRANITDFLSNPPAGLSGTLAPVAGEPSARHMLRQNGYITQESLAVYPNRLPENRGNGYLPPYDDIIKAGDAARNGIFPNFDCNNTGGGERLPGDGGTPPVSTSADPLPEDQSSPLPLKPRNAFAPCYVGPDFPARFSGSQTHGPQLTRDP